MALVRQRADLLGAAYPPLRQCRPGPCRTRPRRWRARTWSCRGARSPAAHRGSPRRCARSDPSRAWVRTCTVTSSGMPPDSISSRRKAHSVSEAAGKPTSISRKPTSTSSAKSRRLRSGPMGSTSAWFPSRRSTLHPHQARARVRARARCGRADPPPGRVRYLVAGMLAIVGSLARPGGADGVSGPETRNPLRPVRAGEGFACRWNSGGAYSPPALRSRRSGRSCSAGGPVSRSCAPWKSISMSTYRSPIGRSSSRLHSNGVEKASISCWVTSAVVTGRLGSPVGGAPSADAPDLQIHVGRLGPQRPHGGTSPWGSGGSCRAETPAWRLRG